MTPGHVVNGSGVVSAQRADALPRGVVVLGGDTLWIAWNEISSVRLKKVNHLNSSISEINNSIGSLPQITKVVV